MPVSAERAVTPFVPPKSEVPGPDEESPQRPDDGRSAAPTDDAPDVVPSPTPADESQPLSPPEAPEPAVEPAGDR